MKKTISLLLAALLLTGLLCACQRPEEPEKPKEPETVVLFSASGESEWTVIFSPEDHFRATGAAFSLWQTVNDRFQYYPGFGKDIWIKQSAGAKEILVGNTDRPESAQALEGLADNEYIIKFDGTKLVINAKDPYGVRYAMRTFLAENPGEIALKTDYVKKGTFEIPETVTVVDSMKRGFNVFIKGYKPEVQEEYAYAALKEGGFDHARIPVNLTFCFDENGDPIDKQVAYIDNAVNWGLKYGLVTLLDFHGWKELCVKSPAQSDLDLFVKIWTFFAQRYKDYPAALCFELFNEPHDMSNATWDELQMRTYNAIRAIDEDRIIFLSPNAYNDPSTFDAMTLPYDDDAVAIDVHDYTPHEFTHQGYDGRATGIAYTHKVYEQFIAQIDKTVENRQSTGLPHIIGEFGVIKNAVVVDAAAFLCDVTTYMEQHDFAWTMWEFGGLKDAYFSFAGWPEVLMKAIMSDECLKYNK